MAARCNASKLTSGDQLYEVSFYTFQKLDGGDVHVRDREGGTILISRKLFEESIYSTKQYEREIRFTRTELAQKIETLGHAAFQVTFRKQVSSSDVADALESQDLSTRAKRRKVAKAAMEGPERKMTARLFRTEDFDASMELGRYRVIDLEEFAKTKDEKTAQRLVDTRTVSELIVDNVRYYV